LSKLKDGIFRRGAVLISATLAVTAEHCVKGCVCTDRFCQWELHL